MLCKEYKEQKYSITKKYRRIEYYNTGKRNTLQK